MGWQALCVQLNSQFSRSKGGLDAAFEASKREEDEKRWYATHVLRIEEGFPNSARWDLRQDERVWIHATWHSPLSHPCQHPGMLSFVITVVST